MTPEERLTLLEQLGGEFMAIEARLQQTTAAYNGKFDALVLELAPRKLSETVLRSTVYQALRDDPQVESLDAEQAQLRERRNQVQLALERERWQLLFDLTSRAATVLPVEFFTRDLVSSHH